MKLMKILAPAVATLVMGISGATIANADISDAIQLEGIYNRTDTVKKCVVLENGRYDYKLAHWLTIEPGKAIELGKELGTDFTSTLFHCEGSSEDYNYYVTRCIKKKRSLFKSEWIILSFGTTEEDCAMKNGRMVEFGYSTTGTPELDNNGTYENSNL